MKAVMGLRFAILFASLGVLATNACGPGDPCVELSNFVCDGGDANYCQQVETFLGERLVGPEGEALRGEPRTQMCSAILGSIEVSGAYRFKARQVILNEPFLDLSKQARDRRLEALKTDEQKAAEAAAKQAQAADAKN